MANQKLSTGGCAFAGSVLWGSAALLVGIINLIKPGYGHMFLWLLSSVYPGYDGSATLGSVLIVTGYALIDGAIGGFLLGWLYNFYISRAK